MDRYSRDQRQSDRPPAFQFGRDQYRPNHSQRASDSYRPANEFSFRPTNAQPAPRFSREQPPRASERSYPLPAGQTSGSNAAPGRRPRERPDGRAGRGARSDRGAHGGRGARGGRKAYYARPPTSARPLLSGERAPTPDQMLEMTEGGARFRALEDLSDSEEEPSDLDHDGNDGESLDTSPQPPRKKIQTSSNHKTDGDSAPKWSNPDPYTVLPPVDETHAKRKDFVRLIRKAKTTVNSHKDPAADGDDFISFGASETIEPDKEPTDDEDYDSGGVVLHISGSNYRMDSSPLHASSTILPPDTRHSPSDQWLPPLPPGPPPPSSNTPVASAWPLPPKPSVSEVNTWPPTPSSPFPSKPNTAAVDTWPPPKVPHVAQDRGLKRGYEAISDTSDKTGTESKVGRKRQIGKGSGLTPAWRANLDRNSAPWYIVDHSSTQNVNVRLHKEICDFYDYVRPLSFEEQVRGELVQRLQNFLDRDSRYRGAEIHCFGSFSAGIYLPDADMDLVVRSKSFLHRGPPTFGTNNKALWQFAGALMNERFTLKENLTVISKAKVPLVKFVDNLTGLKVDISFENSTGIAAIETYRTWAVQYPATAIIVSMVKQFLLMRGLNEVHLGGLGGFTVTCLVVSFIQHMPQIQSGNMDQMSHLGEILMGFFEYYGKKFNTTETGISMNPPMLFQKHRNDDILLNPRKPWSLCIIDPNRYDNDISSGSFKVVEILEAFSAAYDSLQARMVEIETSSNPTQRHGSVLACVYGGSYEPFMLQREQLRRVYAMK